VRDMFLLSLLINAYYIGRKLVGATAARQHIADLLSVLQICPIDSAVLLEAQASPMSDFEDAVQVAAAVAGGVEMIVTRNTDDYTTTSIPVATPGILLQRLQQLAPDASNPHSHQPPHTELAQVDDRLRHLVTFSLGGLRSEQSRRAAGSDRRTWGAVKLWLLSRHIPIKGE
jgi:hypothetical protein